MGLRPDVCQILSPAGLICYPQEQGGSVGATTQPIPGQVVVARQALSYPITVSDAVIGEQGYVDMTVILNASTSGLLFAAVGDVGSIAVYIAANQIQGYIQDINGTTIGLTTLTTAFDAGTLRLVFLWDSNDVLLDPDYAVLLLNGETPGWDTEPATPWTPFKPNHIVFGEAAAGAPVFDGTIQVVSFGTIARTVSSPVYEMLPPPVPVPGPGPWPRPWPRPWPKPRPRPIGGGGIIRF